MIAALTVAILVSWILIGVGGWLGWQLLRQNGRILLRLDELEQRLEELEFGEPGSSRPEESPDPKEGRLEASERDGSFSLSSSGGEGRGEEAVTSLRSPGTKHGTAATDGERNSRVNRFGNRSLARTRIKRDGLKAGTSAPSFRLPRLDGGELSLEELRGKRVLLVFSDPHCGPCNALAPHLERFHREALTPDPSPIRWERGTAGQIAVVMVSRGEPRENRAKVKEHGLTFPVLLQQRWEISRLYAMFATPIAYLIDESGIITRDVAVGVEPILALLDQTKAQRPQGAIEALA